MKYTIDNYECTLDIEFGEKTLLIISAQKEDTVYKVILTKHRIVGNSPIEVYYTGLLKCFEEKNVSLMNHCDMYLRLCATLPNTGTFEAFLCKNPNPPKPKINQMVDNETAISLLTEQFSESKAREIIDMLTLNAD